MEWKNSGVGHAAAWSTISNFDAKTSIAKEMANRLRDGDVVGVGSGSTSYLTLRALADVARQRGWHFTAITTSLEMEMECRELQVATTSLLHDRPEWSFDGADEIDDARDMIKGRGGAMVREKLVMASSLDRYVVVDASKKVSHLGRIAAVPLEIVPEAFNLVRSQLESSFDAESSALRMSDAKDGPVITERGNLIVDVKFKDVNADVSARLNAVPGVVGTGLFFGFAPTLICD
ncbi:MAG TPA: ribose 5-phosphate isomerase A [Acidimicrobiales bacterium]|jgi:ribose 5-phosphate isomerase A|nr:ribose 5-phosphate isomerase A [Acidimicrobiales bacterium]